MGQNVLAPSTRSGSPLNPHTHTHTHTHAAAVEYFIVYYILRHGMKSEKTWFHFMMAMILSETHLADTYN